MTDHKPLLIELGTEELPVKALPGLAQAFADGLLHALGKRSIDFGDARTLYSPRRLAIVVEAVAAQQPEQRFEALGPYVNIGLDAEGMPTPALRGFAQKNGLDVAALNRITDSKGERFVARTVKAGAPTAALLQDVLLEAVKAMPIPKPMRWASHDYGFARPLHWMVMLFGDQVVDATLFGVKADRMSRGHRFHHDKPLWIGHPHDYVDALRAAKVLVDADERRARIRDEIETAARSAGGRPRIDAGILEEVNCLTEWPKAILCGFEREFLRVPQEALISTMETNQKFFPVLEPNGRMTERFVGIANIESRDESEVRKGYERVIRPRFADARFFFDEDLKQGLAAMNVGLKNVTYQQKLGSYADKVARVAALASALAPQCGVDADQARRAAELAKADLQSRMVNEFPELQGIAGRYYAAAAGEPSSVANAIDEAYQPRYAGDAIATSKLGQVLAVAERLDTLAGGFAAGLKPTGNKDPFALRRNALGLARTLIEGELPVSLAEALDLAVKFVHADVARDSGALLVGAENGVCATRDGCELYDFIVDRLRGYYADQGLQPTQFEAVVSVQPPSLLDFERRLKAIGEFARMPEADALAAANKRIRNILRKADGAIAAHVDPSLLQEQAERALAESVEAAIRETDSALAAHDYVAVLRRMAWLREPVDRFFDGVMVMADDPAVRANRLALLKRLADRFLTVADVSQLSA